MAKRYNKIDPFLAREAKHYADPIPSREFIITYLKEKNAPVSYQHLSEALGVHLPNPLEALRRRLIAMVRDGQLIQDRRKKYGLVSDMKLICGKVIRHREGYGMVMQDSGKLSVRLAPRQMRSVMHGDKVLVRVIGKYRGVVKEGALAEILERGNKNVIGYFCESQGINFVIPKSKHISRHIMIPSEHCCAAKAGDIVEVALLTYPDKRSLPTGKVTAVLGKPDNPQVQVKVVLGNYQLPDTWSPSVNNEIKLIKKNIGLQDTFKDRKDLKHLPFMTLDGEDAKDFDDAICCQHRGKDKGWTLWVAIADVSQFVKPGSALDQAAYERGNSVYLPNHVIPMLPEYLSNGLCSLKPNEDRFVLVCEMQIAESGELNHYRFYPAVIHSYHRVTYRQAAELLKVSVYEKNKDKEIASYLHPLMQVYRALYSQRICRGAILFELPQIRTVFNESGRIQCLEAVHRNDAERLVEECMLLANCCAADFFRKHRKPTLYRVHDRPEKEKLQALQSFLEALGLRFEKAKKLESAHYAKLLASIQDREDCGIIESVLLRSMSQAVYQPQRKPHFGLAYDAYCHFTSPIRRYADLIVHRGIYALLTKSKPASSSYPYTKTTLSPIGVHCSMTERRADEASRQLMQMLKCDYMLDKIGQTYQGIITSVVGFGVFVQLEDLLIEGLVHITALEDDYYHFHALYHQLVGKYSGKIYRIGDRLVVRVVRVDVEDCQIDFELA